MKSKALFLAATFTSVALAVSIIPFRVGQTQPVQLCESDGMIEPASETSRVIELHNFGITIAIPSNYRTMRLQNGAVEILHPDDFAFIQCVSQGGAGARGYYSERIQKVDRNPSMSLREQAIWAVGYSENANGDRVPIATEVIEYRQNNLNGYIVTSEIGYSVVFLGSISGQSQLLEISAACDCPVEVEAVTDLLSRVQPLD